MTPGPVGVLKIAGQLLSDSSGQPSGWLYDPIHPQHPSRLPVRPKDYTHPAGQLRQLTGEPSLSA